MATKIKQFLKELNYGVIFVTIICSAINAFGTFIHANAVIPEGGVIGLSLMIDHLSDGEISYTLVNFLINALLCLLAWRLMGTKYMVNVAVALTSFSIFSAIFNENIPNDIFVDPKTGNDYYLLAALVGAIFIEVGTGIMLRVGSAPNGDHAFSMAIVREGEFDFGWVNFLRDFVVIVLSLCYTDVNSVAFAIIIMTATNPISEYIVKGNQNRSGDNKNTIAKRGWIPRTVISLLVVVLLIGGITLLEESYYSPDKDLISTMPAGNVEEMTFEVDSMDLEIKAYVPEGEIVAGLVFYPGGMVDFNSYEPLLRACADQGILCVIPEMPYNLAVLGPNKAIKAMELFPEVETWYIGGHSLGGAMASTCAAIHPGVFEGVILLAAYSTNDITDLRVLSIYGTNDLIMNRTNYESNLEHLPKNFEEHVIIGGNHAYFGMYGEQEGDGEAIIENAEQIEAAAGYIYRFITK